MDSKYIQLRRTVELFCNHSSFHLYDYGLKCTYDRLNIISSMWNYIGCTLIELVGKEDNCYDLPLKNKWKENDRKKQKI